MKHKIFAVLGIVVLLAGMLVAVVSAAVGVDSSELRGAVSAGNIWQHLAWFEDNGPRVPGTPGYDAAADYVADLLDDAGYVVNEQPFDFWLWEELADPVLDAVSPDLPPYPPYELTGFATMEYSGSGDVTEPVVHAANFGCDASDFDPTALDGKIALILRGVCNFSVRAINAQNAGAAGAIVYNDEARQDAFLGTLGGPGVTIPVVGSSYAVGRELADNNATVHLFVSAQTTFVPTYNVIAETPGGRDDRVVVVGAHLDSVAAGPGINDNGSGVAAILEIALQMADLGIEPRNKVVFAFWSAEESGLVGAEYYVSQLGKRGIKNTALNLNFDMLASNNYALFVYDGDGSDTPEYGAGPTGSANIEDVFLDYFASQELITFPTAFDGRSDYGPFIDVGIPAGGLFSGGDGIMTDEQAEIYDGTAGEFYDPYYHTSGDTLANINPDSLDAMSDAVAHAVLTFAMTTSAVPGTSKASPKAIQAMEFKGPKAQR